MQPSTGVDVSHSLLASTGKRDDYRGTKHVIRNNVHITTHEVRCERNSARFDGAAVWRRCYHSSRKSSRESRAEIGCIQAANGSNVCCHALADLSVGRLICFWKHVFKQIAILVVLCMHGTVSLQPFRCENSHFLVES